MDIGAIKTPNDFGSSTVYTAQIATRTQGVVSTPSTNASDGADKAAITSVNNKIDKKDDLQDVKKMTEAINKFVDSMNVNIKFTVHEKTNELMVQVVDPTNNKILKEFPSSEFLDTMAAIRDYVGILLDKKI